MRKLLEDPERFYTPKKRPSGHDISVRFAVGNGGAIPSNLLEIPNTESTSHYLRLCKLSGIEGHPARFPEKLPAFFIKFLTGPGDLVLDFFAGSNTTGMVSEALGRRWIAFELDEGYFAASVFRFARHMADTEAIALYQRLCREPFADLPIPNARLPI